MHPMEREGREPARGGRALRGKVVDAERLAGRQVSTSPQRIERHPPGCGTTRIEENGCIWAHRRWVLLLGREYIPYTSNIACCGALHPARLPQAKPAAAVRGARLFIEIKSLWRWSAGGRRAWAFAKFKDCVCEHPLDVSWLL